MSQSSAAAASAATSVFCPANKSTKVWSYTYVGIGYQKFTVKISTNNLTVKFTKYWNGIPYSWSDDNPTTVNAYPGYTLLYATPPSDCYITVVASGL